MTTLPSMVSLVGIFAIVVALPALGNDTTYRDPRNPSFTLLVPDGWTAKRTDQGVSLGHGNTTVMLVATSGSRPADDMLTDVVSQMQKQAKNFHDTGGGACRFGGQKGAYAQFSGIGPNGTAEVTKVITMTNGQLVYMMIQEVRPDEYEDEKRDLQRIQDSFAPEALPTSVDDREKLDALYAAGVIGQQEYEARKRNLGGSASAPSRAGPTGNGGDSGFEASPRPPGPTAAARTDRSSENRLAGVPAISQVQRYAVVHFALTSTMNWLTDNCVGLMTIDNGVIVYRAQKGTHGLHSFEIPIASIKEAKRNALMGSAFQAFHIRLKTGENYDFSLLNNTGQQVENPAILLDAIHAAMK